MTTPEPGSAARPGRTLGCVVLPLTLVGVAFLAGVLIIFLESGADSGVLVLEQREAYARGSIEYNGSRNFYLVRLADGSFLALSDLDAANRANSQRRCRAAPIPITDPALPALLDRYRSRLTPPAAQATLLFREDCNSAIYDLAGARLDTDAPNLDRYAVSIREDGRVTVDVRKRQCTHRDTSGPFGPTSCGS